MTLSKNTSNMQHRERWWQPRSWMNARINFARINLLCALACAVAWSGSYAQDQTITPNFKDAPLDRVIQAVQTITGKTVIIDPRVRAQVTILSSTPMSADAFYQAFLSVLQVHDFVAVESGNTLKIVPAQNSRWMPGNDLPGKVSSSSDEMVTQVIAVKNVSALQLVPVLRPLLPQGAHFVAHAGSNTLIVSDRASNVSRIMRIIERIDQAGDDEIDIVRLENAAAADVVRTLSTLYTGAGAQQEAGSAVPKVIADDRTNSVLLTGEKAQRLRLKALIADLDTPLATGGDTQVRYLNYADAEAIAGKLKEQITGIVQATPGAVPAAAGGAAAADKSVSMWADPQTNALIITAPPKVMRSLMSVIDKLDIRRPQVLIEAILVEISTTKAAELGVNWAVYDSSTDSTVPIGLFNQSVGSTSIGSIAAALEDTDSVDSSALPTGLTLGAGKIVDAGLSFAVLLRALRGDSSTNILQTPTITTLDNEEAEIKVAQEVPFLTGSYSSTGSSSSSSNSSTVNPFQTIQREEVGEILKITPQINEGNSVTLKVEQESSGIAQGTSGAVDLITNKRTISTKVMVEDGGIIVLGGLISDSALESENRVPVLGSIPIIGELFKTRSGSKEKRNLMVFIRPTILRDEIGAAVATNAKYGVIRDAQQRRRGGDKVKLLPGERQPVLPPIEELSKYADPTAGAEPPAPGTDAQKLEQELETAPEQPPPAEPEEFSPPPR